MPLPKLLAGNLRDRIEIRRATMVDDGRGGQETAWQPIGTVWAEVIGLDGRESVIGQALQGISSYRIRIRWRSGDIAPRQADQIRYRSVDLNVRSVSDPDGRREQLMIMSDTASAQTT